MLGSILSLAFGVYSVRLPFILHCQSTVHLTLCQTPVHLLVLLCTLSDYGSSYTVRRCWKMTWLYPNLSLRRCQTSVPRFYTLLNNSRIDVRGKTAPTLTDTDQAVRPNSRDSRVFNVHLHIGNRWVSGATTPFSAPPPLCMPLATVRTSIESPEHQE